VKNKLFKFISLLLCFCFFFEQTGLAQVSGQLDISGHFAQLRNSIIQDKFRPLHLRYLSYDNLNNNFNLLLDKGDAGNLNKPSLEDTTKTLLNYFFIGISLPNDSFWVNLRPDAEDNIIDPFLARTDLGKVLLEADLQLKKDTAQYTSPETPEGKEYWDKLYKKAEELLGADNINIPTLTRPWIVPHEIIIREADDNAYIYKATLKVMLEQDYLKGSSVYNFEDERLKSLNEYASALIREKILPKITKEVNTAKRYAPLRQVYYSLIMAQWFKARFYGKGGLYSWMIDKKNLNGLSSRVPWSKSTYFNEYRRSFKDGEYNLKIPVATPMGRSIRSYFSGGMNLTDFQVPAPGASSPVVSSIVGHSRAGSSPLARFNDKGISFFAEGGTLEDPSARIELKSDVPVFIEQPDTSPQGANASSSAISRSPDKRQKTFLENIGDQFKKLTAIGLFLAVLFSPAPIAEQAGKNNQILRRPVPQSGAAALPANSFSVMDIATRQRAQTVIGMVNNRKLPNEARAVFRNMVEKGKSGNAINQEVQPVHLEIIAGIENSTQSLTATSGKGAKGLMQIREIAFRDLMRFVDELEQKEKNDKEKKENKMTSEEKSAYKLLKPLQKYADIYKKLKNNPQQQDPFGAMMDKLPAKAHYELGAAIYCFRVQRYVNVLIKKFPHLSRLQLSLAVYNAGFGTIWNKKIPKETSDYVVIGTVVEASLKNARGASVQQKPPAAANNAVKPPAKQSPAKVAPVAAKRPAAAKAVKASVKAPVKKPVKAAVKPLAKPGAKIKKGSSPLSVPEKASSPLGSKTVDKLNEIIARIANEDPVVSAQAYRELIIAGHEVIPENIYTLGKVENYYNTAAIRDAVRKGVVIPISDFKGPDGSVIIQGNAKLFEALKRLHQIPPGLGYADGLCFSLQVYSKMGGLQQRVESTPYEEGDGEPFVSVKGGGANTQGRVRFELRERNADNVIEGSVMNEEVIRQAEKARLFQEGLEKVRLTAREQGQAQVVADDIFFSPALNISPLQIIIDSIDKSGNNDEDLSSDLRLRQAQQKGGYWEVTQGQGPSGVFLVPLSDFPELSFRTGDYSGDWNAYIWRMRLFVYASAAPWRIAELWRFKDFFMEKCSVLEKQRQPLGASKTAAQIILDDFVSRYAAGLAIIHKVCDSVTTDHHFLQTYNAGDTMLSEKDIGYSFFDYDASHTKEEYVQGYLEDSGKAEDDPAAIAEALEGFYAIQSQEREILKKSIRELASAIDAMFEPADKAPAGYVDSVVNAGGLFDTVYSNLAVKNASSPVDNQVSAGSPVNASFEAAEASLDWQTFGNFLRGVKVTPDNFMARWGDLLKGIDQLSLDKILAALKAVKEKLETKDKLEAYSRDGDVGSAVRYDCWIRNGDVIQWLQEALGKENAVLLNTGKNKGEPGYHAYGLFRVGAQWFIIDAAADQFEPEIESSSEVGLVILPAGRGSLSVSFDGFVSFSEFGKDNPSGLNNEWAFNPGLLSMGDKSSIYGSAPRLETVQSVERDVVQKEKAIVAISRLRELKNEYLEPLFVYDQNSWPPKAMYQGELLKAEQVKRVIDKLEKALARISREFGDSLDTSDREMLKDDIQSLKDYQEALLQQPSFAAGSALSAGTSASPLQNKAEGESRQSLTVSKLLVANGLTSFTNKIQETPQIIIPQFGEGYDGADLQFVVFGNLFYEAMKIAPMPQEEASLRAQGFRLVSDLAVRPTYIIVNNAREALAVQMILDVAIKKSNGFVSSLMSAVALEKDNPYNIINLENRSEFTVLGKDGIDVAVEVVKDGENYKFVERLGDIAEARAVASRKRDTSTDEHIHKTGDFTREQLQEYQLRPADKVSVTFMGVHDALSEEDVTNFLINVGKESIFVDPSLEAYANLKKRNLLPARWILTHNHADHNAGFVQFIIEKYAEAKKEAIKNGRGNDIGFIVRNANKEINAFDLIMTREVRDELSEVIAAYLLGAEAWESVPLEEAQSLSRQGARDLLANEPVEDAFEKNAFDEIEFVDKGLGITIVFRNHKSHPVATYGFVVAAPQGNLGYVVDTNSMDDFAWAVDKLKAWDPQGKRSLLISENGVPGIHLGVEQLQKAAQGDLFLQALGSQGDILLVHSKDSAIVEVLDGNDQKKPSEWLRRAKRFSTRSAGSPIASGYVSRILRRPVGQVKQEILALEKIIDENGYQVVGGVNDLEAYRLLMTLTGKGVIARDKAVYSPVNDYGLSLHSSRFIQSPRAMAAVARHLRAAGRDDIRVLVIGSGTGVDVLTAYAWARSNNLKIHLDTIDILQEAVDNTVFNLDLLFPGSRNSEVFVHKVERGREFDMLSGEYDFVYFNSPNTVYDAQVKFDGAHEIGDTDYKRLLSGIEGHLSHVGIALIANTVDSRKFFVPGLKVIQLIVDDWDVDASKRTMFTMFRTDSVHSSSPMANTGDAEFLEGVTPEEEAAVKTRIQDMLEFTRKQMDSSDPVVRNSSRSFVTVFSGDHLLRAGQLIAQEAQKYLISIGVQRPGEIRIYMTGGRLKDKAIKGSNDSEFSDIDIGIYVDNPREVDEAEDKVQVAAKWNIFYSMVGSMTAKACNQLTSQLRDSGALENDQIFPNVFEFLSNQWGDFSNLKLSAPYMLIGRINVKPDNEPPSIIVNANDGSFGPIAAQLDTAVAASESAAQPRSSSPIKKGGIDMRSLPIVTQPMNTPGMSVMPPLNRLENIDLDEEWQQIQGMIQAGIIPASDRIKEYLQACCVKGDINPQVDKVLSCIADILRLEEDQLKPTEAAFREFLALLESDKPAGDLQVALARIAFTAKEPLIIE